MKKLLMVLAATLICEGEMQWTALRQNADGTTAQQGMRWVKVSQ